MSYGNYIALDAILNQCLIDVYAIDIDISKESFAVDNTLGGDAVFQLYECVT
jgi:hypothetical protein